MSGYAPFTGHKKANIGRNFKRYCVWNRKTGEIVASCDTAKVCAKKMRVSLEYFYALRYYQSIGRCKRWEVESYFEDEKVE